MKRLVVLLIVIVALGVTLGFLPCCSPSSAASESVPAPKVATLKVEKMTCGGCAMSVKMLVKKIDGVADVEVSYEEKKAIVTYDSTRTSADEIARTINEKLPYVATVLSDEAAKK